MCNSDEQRQTTLTWHLIRDGRAEQMPVTDTQVLVYDEGLNDVVTATLDDLSDEHDRPLWIDDLTGDPLPAPLWWAEKPFPEL